jgi:hypothetical protein
MVRTKSVAFMAVIIKFFALPVLDVIHQKKDVNDLQLYPLCVYVLKIF